MATKLLDIEGFRAWLKTEGDWRMRGSFAIGCEIIARYLRGSQNTDEVSVGTAIYRVGDLRSDLPEWAERFIGEVYGSRHLTGAQALKILDSV